MDNFLKRYKVLKLTQEELNHLNSPICITEIKFMVKNPSEKKILGPGILLAIIWMNLSCIMLSRGSQT